MKDRNRDNTLKIKHISTKENIEDPLTKGLPPILFQKHVLGMGLVSSLDQVWFRAIKFPQNKSKSSDKVSQ